MASAEPAPTGQQMDCIVQAIRQTPIVDHHAHPLLRRAPLQSRPLLGLASEAHGAALDAGAGAGVPHHRAVQQLAAVLACPATWAAVAAAVEARRDRDYAAWAAQCLAGLETVLLDDGLDDAGQAYDYTWHDQLTRSPCRRIVRIETLAAEIIDRHCQDSSSRSSSRSSSSSSSNAVFDSVVAEFDAKIRHALADPAVVAFKSVVCYRTGLTVPRDPDLPAARAALAGILALHADASAPSGVRFRRLQHPGLNELFVHRTAALIRDSGGDSSGDSSGSRHVAKPIQFHTGLGDNDITLTTASPAHLQDFIRAYTTVPIVLLHAGYPHMRDAGYLATVYANVYVDFGEIFPVVARHGQEATVREILEVCPWTKVLWSTDGHSAPETYLLAILQVREVLETVICDFVRQGQIGWRTAVQLVQDVLFQNANRLYGLQLRLPDSAAPGRGGDGSAGTATATATATVARPRSDLETWNAFLKSQPTPPDFVRINWLDYTATPRMRMVPFRRFNEQMRSGRPIQIGITKACLGMLQNDTCISGVNATGQYRLVPDLSSLRAGPINGHVSIHGQFFEDDGSPCPLCPRTVLLRALGAAADAGLQLLAGFEIEFVLMRRKAASDVCAGNSSRFEPLPNDAHAWSAARFYRDPALARLLRDIVQDLDKAGIEVEQVHAESAPGQFEVVLPPKPPLAAVDALLHARETIAHRAAEAGYVFTLHPKPFAQACGTASHLHLSLAGGGGEDVDPGVYNAFYAGVLTALPALAALTCASPASDERMVDGAWAGGRWVAWGTQNREALLRKIQGSHWEIKCFDGTANPYLALAGVVHAGVSGVREKLPLAWGDCPVSPAALSRAERAQLGIQTSVEDRHASRLGVLSRSTRMHHLLGDAVVDRYVAVKQAEFALYQGIDADQRRDWVIERY